MFVEDRNWDACLREPRGKLAGIHQRDMRLCFGVLDKLAQQCKQLHLCASPQIARSDM